MKNIPIGELLKETGYIDEAQLQQALAFQRENRQYRLGAAMIHLGFVTEQQVLDVLSQKLNIPLIQLSTSKVDPAAVGKIPRVLAEKYSAIAIATEEHRLVVVINDPLNFYAIEDIRQVTQMPNKLLLAENDEIKKAIDYYYSEVDARSAVRQADQSADSIIDEIDDITNVDMGDASAPIVKLLNSLLLRGYSNNASDVHLEPFGEQSIVRMRVDGMLIEYATLKKSLHPALIVRLKIMANLDIAEKRLPQDGHFRVSVEGQDLNVRVSIIPTVHGEKAVLRFLAPNSNIDYAESFGMTKSNYARFMQILSNPNGIVYITGPTGSGKTTTMYMVLQHFQKMAINISSIEDPVERSLTGINQMQVNVMAGLTFDTGLRALMRQDPDIIMVGETRDMETASISVRAAITGHLVISTLHTNDAISSVLRLEDMGIAPYLVGSSVVGLLAQRLVRKICPYCAEEIQATDHIRALLGANVRSVRRGKGCHVCNQTGYKGRTAIHEVVMVDKRMQRMISENAPLAELERYAREQHMGSLRDGARDLVLEGVTSIEEFIKVAASID
ncbi:Flp pilus assembly complex ATPase component TadA [Eubacteriales bacterium OttesenSCG-928-K08]|nr:Flp pilus assembly complex ATPase component TadA [Eubacteriales bacterium OttesenSCG-928-K08]